MMEQPPLFCGIRKSFNNRVDAAILSFPTSSFYLEYFDDSDPGFDEFHMKLQSIQSELNNHSLVIGIPILNKFSSDKLDDFIFNASYPLFQFHNKLINTIFLYVDFELDKKIKNASVPLAAITASTFLTQKCLQTKLYISIG